MDFEIADMKTTAMLENRGGASHYCSTVVWIEFVVLGMILPWRFVSRRRSALAISAKPLDAATDEVHFRAMILAMVNSPYL